MKQPPRQQIDHDRLIRATDAVIEAIQELQRGNKQVRYPPDLIGPNRPACLSGFTRFEVEEAMAFLARLGVVELG